MANLPIKQFLGLRLTSDPEIGTASVLGNFRRNITRGRLENIDGVTTISRTGYTTLGALPGADGTGGVSAPVWKRIFSFFVADNGGSNVYAAIGTYTKTGHTKTTQTFPTAGLWINRYHDGSAWVDGWRELTEFYAFTVASKANNGSELVDVTLDSSVGNPSLVASRVNTGNWTVVLENNFDTNDTGFLVSGMSGNVLTMYGQVGDLASWTNGSSTIFVYRNIFGKAIPSSIAPQIRGVLDEIRVTTGNAVSDLDMAAFYRDKTFFSGYPIIRKGTFGEYGHLNIPSRTFKLRNLSVVASGSTGLPSGAYSLKASILTDDGQETELRDVQVGSFPAALLDSGTDVTLGYSASKCMATDGTNVYVASSLSGATNYIWKLDADGTILSTLTLAVAVEGRPDFIAWQNGFLYAMHMRSDGWMRAVKYDNILGTIATGSWIASWGATTAMIGAINSAYMIIANEKADLTSQYIRRISLATLNEVDNYNYVSGASFEMRKCAANDTYFILTGSNRCLKFPFALAAPTNVYVSMGSVLTNACIIVAGNAYVGASNFIKKWVLADDTITNWYTGSGTSIDSFSYDGTYLYSGQINGADVTRRKMDLSGTVLASIVGTVGYYSMVNANSRLYAMSAGGVLHKYTNLPSSATFISTGTEAIGFDLAVSPGFISRRAQSVRLYISKDTEPYYLVKDYKLLSAGETFSAVSVFDSTVRHRYFVSTGKTIVSADYSAATESALAQLGRAITDSGILPYSYAITANNRTYAVGVFVGGRLIRNKVYMSANHGIGTSQYDVLANDATTVLDVEFNDGDYSLALGNVADRILVLKNRSLVLLTPNNDGSHQRDVVATGVGIASPDSLVAFNETLYWLDHTGVWEFSTRGLVCKSEDITSLVLGWSDTDRAQALGVIDARNLQYRLFVNGVWYVLDLKDGEWATETWAASTNPVAVSVDIGSVSRRYMWVTSSGYLWNPAAGTRFNGSNFSMMFRTNKIELPLERGFDGLVAALYCDYSSSVNLSMSLYLDDAGSPVRTWTLPSTGNGMLAAAPLASKCKSFRIEIGATTTGEGQSVAIRRLGAYFNQEPAGGDRQIT